MRDSRNRRMSGAGAGRGLRVRCWVGASLDAGGVALLPRNLRAVDVRAMPVHPKSPPGAARDQLGEGRPHGQGSSGRVRTADAPHPPRRPPGRCKGCTAGRTIPRAGAPHRTLNTAGATAGGLCLAGRRRTAADARCAPPALPSPRSADHSHPHRRPERAVLDAPAPVIAAALGYADGTPSPPPGRRRRGMEPLRHALPMTSDRCEHDTGGYSRAPVRGTVRGETRSTSDPGARLIASADRGAGPALREEGRAGTRCRSAT
jgi:hypothetical protein